MGLLLGAGLPAASHAAPPALLVQKSSHVIYRDTGRDPTHSHRCYHTDIRSSARTMFRTHGHRYLRVKVDGFFCLASMGSLTIKAWLDTRNGPKAEYLLTYSAFESNLGCAIKRTGSHRTHKIHTSRVRSSGWACRTRANSLNLNKHVRWRFVAQGACGGESHVCGDITDRAPNQGWYS